MLLLTMMMLVVPAQALAESTLYVFLPSNVRPKKLEKLLSEHMPGVTVVAFGRVKDFEKTLASTPPDAILTVSPMVDAVGMKASLLGTRGGTDSEPLFLIAVGQVADQSALEGKTVGMVDLLGRKRMKKLVAKLLNLGKPKVKRVTKPADLLPLLQFEAADLLLVPEGYVAELKSGTELDLKTKGLGAARIGLPALALREGGNGGGLVDAIKKLPKTVNSKLGVESWKAK
ncbi:MAG: hypothetical protein ACE366_11360 [Bradymonadia bacterium]